VAQSEADNALEDRSRAPTPFELEMEASAVASENIQLCLFAAIERAQAMS
jgi:hypothetical protein